MNKEHAEYFASIALRRQEERLYHPRRIGALITSKPKIIEQHGKHYINKAQLFASHGAEFNFEYDADELLSLAIDKGFLFETDKFGPDGDELYLVNEEYKESDE